MINFSQSQQVLVCNTISWKLYLSLYLNIFALFKLELQ